VPATPSTSPREEPWPRLWPGVVIVALQWLVILVPAWLNQGILLRFTPVVFGPFVAATAMVCWWLMGCRLPWSDRVFVLGVCVAFAAVALPLADGSVGVFGLSFMLRILTTAWIVWLLATLSMRWPVRRAGLLVLFLLAWGSFTLVRRDGVDGNLAVRIHPRWSPTAEDRFLAELGVREPGKSPDNNPAAEPLVLRPGDWPGFRGPARDGRVGGVRVATDWQLHPPRPLWRHRIGPGWSSFAVVGQHLYTQEQRGDKEAVVCYDTETGEERWVHSDKTRLVEEQSGPGPRATPTFSEGKIFALGATGRLNCLDSLTGSVHWTHDVREDAGAEVPRWGYCSSPLVTEGVVTVFVGGPESKAVLGYDARTGKLAWSAVTGQGSYSSPHKAHFGTEEQVLLATDAGLTAFHAVRGEILWRFDCPAPGPTCVAQPALLDNGDLLLANGTYGVRRIRLSREGSRWEAREVWLTRALKPFFNDFVEHQGHLYGFDIRALTCVSLEDGKARWRAQGYGNGQALLLTDQDLLLVLSEEGEVALVQASPAGHTELGRFQALEGKTWNHPVVAHGRLFVRNAEEAACYELTARNPAGE
jgi:outer membrane protein assembly factor BamB